MAYPWVLASGGPLCSSSLLPLAVHFPVHLLQPRHKGRSIAERRPGQLLPERAAQTAEGLAKGPASRGGSGTVTAVPEVRSVRI
jgi:hypothetical protein